MSDIAAPDDQRKNLRELDPRTFELGKPLPGAIHSIRGRTLVRRGRVLKRSDLELIREHLGRGILGGDGWPETAFREERSSLLPSDSPAPGADVDASGSTRNGGLHEADTVPHGDLVPLSLERLYVGKTLTQPLYSRNGVLLLAAGMEITHRFLAKLRQQGVCEVHVSRFAQAASDLDESPGGRARLIGELDNVVEHLRRAELTVGYNTVPRRDLLLQALREETARGREEYTRALERVSEIAQDVYRGRAKSIAAAADVVSRFMNIVHLDSSLLPTVVKLKDSPGEYLYQHGLNVALFSMAAAAHLGARRELLLDIGLAGLLHDVGMMEVPDEVRLAPRALTSEERLEVARHPLYSLDFLQNVEGLSQLTLLICYQSHERADGSGYPRRRPKKLIHPYARLVATADAYAAISSHRPYRKARSPYQAMVTLLREGRRDLYDRDVLRSFLDSIALFPIGSYVRLSNGAPARILRANPGHHTKPVVVMLNSDETESDYEIDLSRAGPVHIVQALPHLHEAR